MAICAVCVPAMPFTLAQSQDVNSLESYPQDIHSCTQLSTTTHNYPQCVHKVIHKHCKCESFALLFTAVNANANYLHTGGGVLCVYIINSTRLQMQKAKNNKKDAK